MAILSNTPTLSYIYVKNMVITHNGTPYNILNMYTMKSYIFWDADNPYQLIASNKMLEERVGLYYIIYNNKGNPTEIPQTDLDISFSESGVSGDLITEKIIGFQNSLGENDTRFLTIETDVNHLKTVVGEAGSSGDGSSLFERFSKIEQDVDSINAEVSKIEREYGDDEELRTLRENTNIAILKLQATLGMFLSDMQEFMKDNELTDEEASQITIYKSNMEAERAKLNLQIDNVIARLTEQNDVDNVTKLTTQKNLLNDSIDNLYANIDTVCTDKKFTNTEMVTIISYFSTVGNKINETNSMIDELIFLESGGKLIEELARLTIEQNEIKQIVSKSESDVEDVIIKLEKTIARIDTYYYSSTSKEVLEGGEWSTTAPTWVDGRFLWTKTVTVYTDETTEESDPVCITEQQGERLSSYTWIMYANDENGNGISNDPTDKSYIGFAYNKPTATESDNPSDYTWSRFKGENGLNGDDGEDGTSVKILGSYSSADELKQAHPDNNENGDGYLIDGNLWVWDGTEFIEVGKIKGEDGLTAYVHIKYSNDGGITFTPDNGEEMGDYMGIYTDNIEADSSNVSDYNWKRIKGEDGVPGEKGEDGKPTYTWIRYSDNENGSNMYNTPNSLTVYIGIATNKDTPTESDNPSDYVWSKFKGDAGVDGRGITSVTPQYYLSTSKEQPADGEWAEIQPAWHEDFYLWLRYKIVYNNPVSTEYTTPTLDETWESLKDLKDDMDNTKIQVETIKNDVAEHTVALGSITSKVGSMESTITTITKDVEGLEGQVEENKTVIKETKDTVATHTTSLDSISGRIQVVESNTTNINGELTNLESRMNVAEQTLTKDGLTTIIGESYTTEEKVDKIIVNKDYATRTELEQTTEDITYRFTTSGGYNLLYNGDFKKEHTDWIEVGDIVWTDGLSCPNGTGIYLWGELETIKRVYQYVQVEPNVEMYTLSWYQHTTTSGVDGQVYPFRRPEVVVYYTDGTTEWKGIENQTNLGVWEKRSITINKPDGKSFDHFNVGLWCRDTTKGVYYSEVMLEKGSLSNLWTPNPNEIYDGIASLNKDGLKIEMQDGEGSQGYSLVSYDGFSVHDSNDNKKAWFGQDDSCYIQNLSSDDIRCHRVVKKDEDMPTTFYVNASPPSGSNLSGTSVANACDSINEMIQRIKQDYGQYLEWKNIIIEVASGSYFGPTNIIGFTGCGYIEIRLNPSAKVYGKWLIYDNTVPIVINGGKTSITANDGAELIMTDESHAALFYVRNCYCSISCLRAWNKFCPDSLGEKYKHSFLYVDCGGRAVVSTCDISRFEYGVRCTHGSMGSISNSRGYVRTVAVARYGSFVASSKSPVETTESWADWGGYIHSTDSAKLDSLYDPNYGTSTTNTPSKTQMTFTQSFVITHLQTIPEGSGSSTSGREGQIGQGKWSSYKAHRGWGKIPTTLSEFCTNASNVSMKITMTRIASAHGYAGAVPAPVFVYSSGTWDSGATFSRGQTRTLTLPSGIVSEIASGNMSYIQLWAGESNDDYSFYRDVYITVTCTKNV